MNTLGKAGSEIARALGELVVPLATPAGRTELLTDLGWSLPPGVDDVPIGGLNVGEVLNRLDILERSTDEEQQDTLLMIARSADLAIAIGQFVESVVVLAGQAFQGLPPGFLATTNIVAQFAKRLLEVLVIRYIERESEPLFHLLKLLGIIVVTQVEADPSSFRSAHRRLELVLDRAAALVSPSRSWATEVYGWNTAGYDAPALLTNLRDMYVALGGNASLGTLSRSMEEAFEGHSVPAADTDPMPLVAAHLFRALAPDTAVAGLATFGVRPTSPGGSDGGIGFSPFLVGSAELAFPLYLSETDSWELVLAIDGAAIAGGLVAFVRAGSPIQLRQNFFDDAQRGPIDSGRVGLGVRYRPGAGRIALLDLGEASGFAVSEVELVVGGRAGRGGIEGFGELSLRGGVLTIGTDDADGFLTSLLGGKPLEITVDASVEYSQSGGLRFRGGAMLETTLAVELDLAVVVIRNIYLRLAVTGAGLQLETSAGVVGKFGPVTAVAERIGVSTDLEFREGNVGPANLSVGFKPPTAIGLLVEAGPITGGGFVYLDYAAGRYAGAMELSVYGIAVKAFAVIDTKFPDGRKGFSFVVIISAEFTPIQLGFGFTLLGVGGILGINRALSAEALREAVRSHGLDHVLFPHDPIGDAPAIIHDISAIFPASEGRYVFGPMAKVGWGTPTLIDAEIGIVLQLPGPVIAVLGEVHCVLPTVRFALVKLNFAVVGILDFPQKLFSLDASLHDSSVGGFPVSGDMAMRLSWGDHPNFALAVGGFNPAYKPPPGFPSLSRVTVDLGMGGNPGVTLQGYLAVTSNTAQIGARAELNASGAGIRLHGFIGFDALFIFSPFSFLASFEAGVRVSYRGYGIGVHLHGQLGGPSPWRVKGKVCVSVLFWDACLSFEKTFGGEPRVELPSLDPFLGSPENLPLAAQEVVGLQNALQDPRSWSSVPPAGAFSAVSLREAPSDSAPPIDPLGAATLRQRVVPLNRPITLFGGAKPLGPGRYDIQSVTLGGGISATSTPVQDSFAPANFKEMSNAEKLSAPAFEKMDAGVTIASDQVAVGAVVPKGVAYKTIVIDPRAPATTTGPDFALTLRHLRGMTARSATALAGLRVTGNERFVDPTMPLKVALLDPTYLVALKSNLRAVTGFAVFTSKTHANLSVEAAITADPRLASQLQVVPAHELLV